MIRHSASTVNRSSPLLEILKMAHVQGGDCFCLRYLLSDESWRITLTQKTMEMDFCVVFCASTICSTRQLLPIFSFRFPLSIFCIFLLTLPFPLDKIFLGNQFPVLIEFLFLNVFYFFRQDFYFECCFFISDRRFKTFWQHFIKIGLIFLFLE
jgi:hypothetical protein